MKGSEWALIALRNFKDFIGVEEYFSTLCQLLSQENWCNEISFVL